MPIKIVPRKPQPKDMGRDEKIDKKRRGTMKEAIGLRQDANRERSMAKGMLSGGQTKIAKKAPPFDKIDEKDFAVLRKEKKGRPMKAKRGKFNDVKKFAKAKGLPAPFPRPAGNFGKMAGNFPAIKTAPGSMDSKAEVASKTGSAKEAIKKSLRRRFGVGAALATGIGGALGVGSEALKNLKKKRAAKKRDKAKVKKMGGGMMQRPMGMAKKGKMIKARGGGMARTKPTSMY
jgi:hypothetical protein